MTLSKRVSAVSEHDREDEAGGAPRMARTSQCADHEGKLADHRQVSTALWHL